MDERLRNAIGKAFFDQIVAEEWEKQPDDLKELYVGMAEKVIEAFIQPIMPTLVDLTKSLVGLNQDQQDAIRHIVRVVTGKELEDL